MLIFLLYLHASDIQDQHGNSLFKARLEELLSLSPQMAFPEILHVYFSSFQEAKCSKTKEWFPSKLHPFPGLDTHDVDCSLLFEVRTINGIMAHFISIAFLNKHIYLAIPEQGVDPTLGKCTCITCFGIFTFQSRHHVCVCSWLLLDAPLWCWCYEQDLPRTVRPASSATSSGEFIWLHDTELRHPGKVCLLN